MYNTEHPYRDKVVSVDVSHLHWNNQSPQRLQWESHHCDRYQISNWGPLSSCFQYGRHTWSRAWVLVISCACAFSYFSFETPLHAIAARDMNGTFTERSRPTCMITLVRDLENMINGYWQHRNSLYILSDMLKRELMVLLQIISLQPITSSSLRETKQRTCESHEKT